MSSWESQLPLLITHGFPCWLCETLNRQPSEATVFPLAEQKDSCFQLFCTTLPHGPCILVLMRDKKSYKTWFAFLGYHIFTPDFRCVAERYFVNFPSYVLAFLGFFRTTIRGHQAGKKTPPTFITFLVFKHLSGEEESMKQHLWDASFTAEIRNTFKHKQQLPCLLGQSWPNHSLLSCEWDWVTSRLQNLSWGLCQSCSSFSKRG